MSKKLARIAIPLGLSIALPGIGTALGAALGAGSTFAPIVGNALLGGAAGGLTGGKKNILGSAIMGGLGGAFSGGGSGSLFESTGGIPAGGWDAAPKVASSGLSSLGSKLGMSSANIPSIVGAVGNLSASDDAEEKLLRSQRAAQERLAPYSEFKFDESQFKSDPSYTSRLREGEDSMNRALASRGKYFSGEAVQDLRNYGQDYASREYQNAYNRALQEFQQGRQGATAMGNIDMGIGETQGYGTMNRSNIFSQALAKGMGRRLMYDSETGEYVYM